MPDSSASTRSLRAPQMYPNLPELDGFESWVLFTPAYDCIVNPCGIRGCGTGRGSSHGRHGVDMRWFLRGELGVTQFVVGTGWMPSTSPPPTRHIGYNGRPMWPMATDLGYHSPRPLYEGHMEMDCDLLPGRGSCFYDGSGLNAEPVLEALTTGGCDAVWRELRSYYDSTFVEVQS